MKSLVVVVVGIIVLSMFSYLKYKEKKLTERHDIDAKKEEYIKTLKLLEKAPNEVPETITKLPGKILDNEVSEIIHIGNYTPVKKKKPPKVINLKKRSNKIE